MNKILKSITLTGIFLMLITPSCNMPTAAPPQLTETPATTALPTETATSVAMPTESASATPELAPLCEADASVSTPAQCQQITAEQTSVLCVNKRPFNIIFINKGSTYAALTKGFYCTDGGIKDEKQIITCTGIMASTYQVSVCDPTCVIPTVAAPTTHCPPDYQYDSLKGCCTQDFIQIQQNCRVFKFETSTCKVDCSVYIKKKNCNVNNIACLWIEDEKKCVERK